jgi:signal transduction histidine kinase
MTLRLKIMGVTISLILVSGLATIAAMYFLLSRQMEAELLKRGESVTRHFASSSLGLLLTEDLVTLQLNIREIMAQEEDIRYLFALDSARDVVVHSFADGFPSSLRDANIPLPGEKHRVSPLIVGDETVYDFAVPVGEGKIGVVRLGLSGASIQGSVRRFLGVGLFFILVIVTVVGVVAVLLDHRVTRPVSALTRTVREVDRGSLGMRVDLHSGDEIGELAESFNEMMSRIELSHRELVSLNSAFEQEIAERGEAERRVRASELELQTIFETTPVMMALLDGGGAIKRINRTWSSTLAPDSEHGENSRIGSAVRCVQAVASTGGCGKALPCEDCEVRRIVWDTLSQRVQHVQEDASLDVLGEGEQKRAHFLVSSTPIIVLKEEMALVSIEDVTPIKEAEVRLKSAYEELEKQHAQLQKLDVIKSALIRDVTHELKTPVAKFVMQLEMLKSQLAACSIPTTWRESIERMEKNLRRQESVITNILDLSRLESGKRRYRFERLRLDLLLEEVIDDYRGLMDAQGMTAATEMDAIEIESDRDMLWHVFSNILTNAVKFTRDTPEGRLHLSIGKSGRGYEVRVTDNGIGLSPGEQKEAFDLFFQSSASVEGIGVGLALSRSIVEELGGKIMIESEGRGKGATVTVSLPAEAPSLPA